jgi:hypothetical protein
VPIYSLPMNTSAEARRFLPEIVPIELKDLFLV